MDFENVKVGDLVEWAPCGTLGTVVGVDQIGIFVHWEGSEHRRFYYFTGMFLGHTIVPYRSLTDWDDLFEIQ